MPQSQGRILDIFHAFKTLPCFICSLRKWGQFTASIAVQRSSADADASIIRNTLSNRYDDLIIAVFSTKWIPFNCIIVQQCKSVLPWLLKGKRWQKIKLAQTYTLCKYMLTHLAKICLVSEVYFSSCARSIYWCHNWSGSETAQVSLLQNCKRLDLIWRTCVMRTSCYTNTVSHNMFSNVSQSNS